MNIFMLSYERRPLHHYREQAAFHCDKHVVKMIAESVQLIVTALSAKTPDNLSRFMPPDLQDSFPCKPLALGMSKHPCAIWAREHISHINYLCNLAIALCDEKARRWPLNPWHEYQPWLLALRLEFELLGFKPHDAIPTHFPIAVKSVDLRSISSPHNQVVDIYRSYYVSDKQGFATWRKTVKPLWFVMGVEAASEAAEQQDASEASTQE